MNTYQFSKKQQTKNLVVYNFINTIASLITFLYFGTDSISDDIFFFYAIITFATLIIFLKQLNKFFIEISISENNVKFVYANQMKDSITALKDELIMEISDDKISFKQINSEKFIGFAYKNRIIDKEKWDELILEFSIQRI